MRKDKPETASAADQGKASKVPPKPLVSGAAVGKSTPPSVATQKKPKTGRGLGWFATLLALLALAGVGALGFLGWQEQQKMVEAHGLLSQQQDSLREEQQSLVSPEPAGIAPELEARLQDLSEQIGDTSDALSAEKRQLQSFQLETNSDIQRLASENGDLMQRLVEIGRTDRDDWRLAEVEYLLRLAQQRVVMGGELDSAAALLTTADNILYELNMGGLLAVRKQVARDLAAVQAAAKLDVAGVFLRIDALQQQVGSLQFYGMPERGAGQADPAAADEAEAADWRSQLASFSQQLVVVRKSEGAIDAELSEVGQKLIHLQLISNLEQAKNALMLSEDEVYHAALRNADQLVRAHFVKENRATIAFLASLAELDKEAVSPELPDISASQEAVRAYIDRRYRSQGQAPAAGAEQEEGAQ